jgi:hypothetical protein
VASFVATICAALVVALGDRAAFAAQPTPSGAALLAAYHDALDRLPPMGDVVFQYTQIRSGPTRTLEEEHRVYRNAKGNERNETVAVAGSPMVPAIVRFSTHPLWPYDVRQFAVEAPDYTIMETGIAIVAGRRALGYSSVRTTPGDFAITSLYLDVARALPVREAFNVSGGNCTGRGSIDFGPVAGHWLPLAVTATCSVDPTGETFKETIKFYGYQFPQTLPSDVFAGGGGQ